MSQVPHHNGQSERVGSHTAQNAETSSRFAVSKLVKDLDWADDHVLSKGNAAAESLEYLESPIEKTVHGLAEPAEYVTNAMANSDNAAMKAIAGRVSTWAEQSETLMKTLDGVAQIHPFIAVVVLAFKTAVQLELQRRDNDQKVGALRVQRLDMMSVLCDLRHVADEAAAKTDTRLLDLIQQTANDIKECTHVCDKYVQKSLFVKVCRSGSWGTKLSAFGTLFITRKSDFQFALAVYTGKGVDQANEAIKGVQRTVRIAENNIDMLVLFKMLESPVERVMMQQVQAKGGAAKVMGSDKLLKEVMDAFPTSMTTLASTATKLTRSSNGGRGNPQTRKMQSLKKELNESIDAVLERERAVFEAKFDVQKMQLTELKAQVIHEGDRVIDRLLASPGDRLQDPNVHHMWKEMGWKTSARADRFVHVLRDYYIERYAEEALRDQGSTKPANAEEEDKTDARIITAILPPEDKWTLKYIGYSRLQPISEAFDDDASGYVTVQEVNKFTSSRPSGWSLPHWVAFWAAGWHLSLRHYATKINTKLVPAMLKLSDTVLPANRGKVDRYFSSQVFHNLHSIITSINPCKDSDHLLDHFQSYIDKEEKRLDSNLKPLKYEIDALNTLTLVTGHGRFERFLFPLMYLVLSHHHRLIELSTREIVPDQEIKAALDTLGNLWSGAWERMNMMKAVFEHQHIDAKTQFQRTAHGMFNYMISMDKFDKPDSEYPTINDLDEETTISRKLRLRDLKYPLTKEDTDDLDQDIYDSPISKVASRTEEISTLPFAASANRFFIGWWDGVEFFDGDPDHPDFAVGRITFSLDVQELGGRLSGSGFDDCGTFMIRPAAVDGEGNVLLRLKYSAFDVQFQLKGKISDDGNFVGNWKWATDTFYGGRFVLERHTAAAICRSRPHPNEFKENRGKALWSLARTGVLQHLWSWTYFKERRDARKRFVELHQQDSLLLDGWSNYVYIGEVDNEKREELTALKVTLSTRDQKFYRSLSKQAKHHRVRHPQAACGCCGKDVVDIRYFCAICLGMTINHSMDFCVDHFKTVVTNRDKGTAYEASHDDHHPMVKARRIVLFRDLLRIRNRAKECLDHAIGLLKANGENPEKITTENRDDESVDNPSEAHKCIGCQKAVAAPCYTCIDGKCDNVFICEDCEDVKKVSGWAGSTHALEHLLLRIPELADREDVSVEEEKPSDLDPVQRQLADMERRYTDNANELKDRMSRLEDLMMKLLHLNVSPTSSNSLTLQTGSTY